MADQVRPVRLLVLDLDSTVRWDRDELGHHVHSPAAVRVFPEVPPLLRRYRAERWRIIGASNQKGIAKGQVTSDAVRETMAETQRQCGMAFDAVRWCPHDPDAPDPMVAVCWCRKPRAGMVIEAALELARRHRDETYPPHLGLMVGDRPEDRGCAEACGVPFMQACDWRAGAHLAALAEARRWKLQQRSGGEG